MIAGADDNFLMPMAFVRRLKPDSPTMLRVETIPMIDCAPRLSNQALCVLSAFSQSRSIIFENPGLVLDGQPIHGLQPFARLRRKLLTRHRYSRMFRQSGDDAILSVENPDCHLIFVVLTRGDGQSRGNGHNRLRRRLRYGYRRCRPPHGFVG